MGGLLGALQLMELVDLVRPTFMTLEEVTTFLLTSLRLDHKEKGGGTRQVRYPILNFLFLVLCCMRYQPLSSPLWRLDSTHSRCT